MSKPRVCVIVPAYREASRLPIFLESLSPHLPISRFDLSIRVVDDGSPSDEQAELEAQVRKLKLSCVTYRAHKKNRGKGAVLREGFKEALAEDFDYIGFLDGDGATGFADFFLLVEQAIEDSSLQVLLASRWRSLGRRVERSVKRHVSGRIFATLLAVIYSIPVYDSQCGAKLFKSESLSNELLDACYDDRWLFDTQLVILSYLTGRKMLEVPINWIDQPGSKVRLVRDSWRMLRGLLTFRRSNAFKNLARLDSTQSHSTSLGKNKE